MGSLLWVAICTRTDIACAVYKAIRRTHSPTITDWNPANKIARYLKGTKSLKISMGKCEYSSEVLKVKAYSKAGYAGAKEDRKLTTGGLIFVDGILVIWICKKHGGVSLSTVEVEYYAA
ncbi:hypothetical protein PsorP6_005770 [Peronosclerospora sorghi]|uniref:Uncharacterized protein n=1 Tax=Peronosclerospora sorghi TaxID=230839 RepID=A0ACC0W5A5_9STRA|nr:hypothetical protein PsorP6_005770 [Peronosclerospora sorghi]